MRILVADDEPTYRTLVRIVLSDSGYEVIEARDGREAWETLNSENAPQLAVVDWMMPHMDGIEVCQRVKQGDRGTYFYIILLTGRNRREDHDEGLNAGADDFFPKPINVTDLIERVEIGRRQLEARRGKT